MNGTTNYILSRMADEGLDYEEVLADAQRLGYAEADPSADVDGFDAASKIAILSSIGFATRITTDDVFMQGIRTISAEDIEAARDLGYAIKMLAIGHRTGSGIDMRVHPAMIPATHPLAGVSGAMNAVYVVGDAVGETMFYGAGAGAFPTASAVVGDVLALAESISAGVNPLPEPEPYSSASCRSASIRGPHDPLLRAPAPRRHGRRASARDRGAHGARHPIVDEVMTRGDGSVVARHRHLPVRAI